MLTRLANSWSLGEELFLLKIRYALNQFFRLPPELNIHPQVRKEFKNNFFSNLLYIAAFDLGESFISTNTILPVFASMITESAMIVGMVPALIRAGSLIPSFFLAPYVNDLPRKIPFAKATARISHITPFFLLALTPFFIVFLTPGLAIWIFMAAVLFRGFLVGVSNMPWFEVIAIVIPSQVRSRFFGVSILAAQVLGTIGSVIAGFILANLIFPFNFGISFLIGATFISFSYFIFNRTVEPEVFDEPDSLRLIKEKESFLDLSKLFQVIQSDQNFRKFITSRLLFQLGNMPIYYVAVFGIKEFDLGNEFAAVFSVILILSGMAGSILLSMKGDYLGPRSVLLFSSWVRSFMILAALLAPSIGWYYLVFVFLGWVRRL
jgi:MFS family permease